MRPIPPTPQQKYKNLGVITTPFGGQTAFESSHPGVDIANTNGTPIPSPVDGQVVAKTEGQPQGQGFGNFVTVKDGDGNKHYFSHLKKGYVKVGDRVQKGQTLAEMGNSGAAYSKSGQGDGTHLDYRIVNASGKYLNPTNFL
jgi:murein DD-endopeptidase MepM/ murein hydrolase activator NlpD